MFKIHRRILMSISLFLLGGIILGGCERSDRSPIAPEDDRQLTNCYCIAGREGALKAYVGEDGKDLLSVNVLPGSYRLRYQVQRLKSSPTFDIDFKTSQEVTLCLGLLEDDILVEVVLYEQIFEGDVMHVDGPLELYAFPGGWNGWTGSRGVQAAAVKLPTNSNGTVVYRDGRLRVPEMANTCHPAGPLDLNTAPEAHNVNISGTEAVGQTLTGAYDYNDAEGDPEGTSTYQWYRADDASGTNSVAIAGATSQTYLLKGIDFQQYLRFEVTPVAVSGTSPGSAAPSGWSGVVACAAGGESGDFCTHADGTVTQISTGLMWEQTPNNSIVNWCTAISICEGSSKAGYSDWRLASKDDWRGLTGGTCDHSCPDWTLPTGHPFSSVQEIYWTSTEWAPNPATCPGGSGDAWVVELDCMHVHISIQNSSYYVWCVRG